jgi:hypothetical protein
MLSWTGMDTKFRTAPVLYFQHHLGPDIDMYNINAQLYLAAPHTGSSIQPYISGYVQGYNQTHTSLYSFQGQDSRNVGFVDKAILDQQGGKPSFNGIFTKIELTAPTYRNDGPGNVSNYNQPSAYNYNAQRAASICYLDGKIIGLQLLPGLVDAIGTGMWDANLQIGQYSNPEYTLGTKRQFEYLRLVIRRDV